MFSVLIIGCNNLGQEEAESLDLEQDFKTVKVGKAASINIPKYMSSTTGITGGNSLVEYSHLENEVYVAVFELNKKDIETTAEAEKIDADRPVLELFRELQLETDSKSTESLEHTNLKISKIGNLESAVYETDVKVLENNQEITYIDGFIQYDQKMILIRCWTLTDNIHVFRNTFLQVINSFQPL
jgi:hypothetical protein